MAAGISRYTETLGLWQGLRLYALSKYASQPFAVQVPDVSHPVWVRPRTSDRNMLSDVLLEQEYDLPLDPPPRFIIDAGANVGYTSAFLASRHPQAQIAAIEPEDSNFAQLTRNLEPFTQVTPIKAGLWPREAYLYVANPGDVKSGFRMAESADPRPDAIAATTIPALMGRFGAQTIDICKIDVEGGECEIFADPSCHEWLAKTRMLIIELHDRFRPDSGELVRAALSQHPHTCEEKGDNLIFRLRAT